MKRKLIISGFFLYSCFTSIYGQTDIKISLVKWSFRTQTELLCQMAKDAHVEALEMVDPLKWDIVLKNNLEVAMADGADLGVEKGFCDKRWHKELLERYTYILPELQKRGIKQLVCYSGINTDLSDEEAMEVCVQGLKPVLREAEKAGIILSMELISSKESSDIFTKQSFKYYQCDNMEWAVTLCEKLNSPNFKLLYDIWHMQDMGRNVFEDVKKYHQYISHYHIAAYPKRNALRASDELNYEKLMKEIQKTGYKGYIGLEPDRIELNLDETIKQSVNTLKNK